MADKILQLVLKLVGKNLRINRVYVVSKYLRSNNIVKAVVFPVVIDGCESWTINKAEHRRTDAFELMLENILESTLGCKEIKPINPKGNQP